ncbi:MAG TPA: 1,4-alpha-glucan branching protein GlgB [Actinomycetota bacterium]|nr:1,4-alpha-glucan branching protein GlgB [Actinomycetota bacterium]
MKTARTTAPKPETDGWLGDEQRHLFAEGTESRLWEQLGAHPYPGGVRFAVWAPNAERVSVVGSFNEWDPERHDLSPVAGSGIWAGSVSGAVVSDLYKFHIRSRYGGYRVDKADPVAFRSEVPPRSGSVVADLAYRWEDEDWMAERGRRIALAAPVSIYEMHLGSWRRGPDGAWLGYREVAEPLAAHVRELGFTHVELLPIMEHPFYGSWGYQTTGYFAPTARYGEPTDLMALIDHLHRAGIGVILDWVPSHFPTDEHGLAFFDGTHLYEHADPRLGFHPDWGTLIFNYARREVQSFLRSSALFWLDVYHADGLRVDAVASMLYLDYSRSEGEWIPNRWGGRENLDAIEFLRDANRAVYLAKPDVHTIAEESTAWPMVSRPTDAGGLGFGYKWDMGWMHDTLAYLSEDPIHRRYHHEKVTFRQVYAGSESFVLPLSHDEVVHGKGSLLGKMPGDDWQRRANLRLLLADLFLQNGKKLLFMGGELGQTAEWDHDGSLAWSLRDDPRHEGIVRWVADLNDRYRTLPALHELDCDPHGFHWLEADDAEHSILAFLRLGAGERAVAAAVCNFTPVPREGLRLGVPVGGMWTESLNSDDERYGGSGIVHPEPLPAEDRPWQDQPYSLTFTLPPLACVLWVPQGPA